MPAIVYIVAAVWALTACIWRFVNNNLEEKSKEHEQHPNSLLGCILVLYELLTHVNGIEAKDTEEQKNYLRIPMHRVVPSNTLGKDPEELEQILPYVGGQGRYVGSRTSIYRGTVGQAIRTKSIAITIRESEKHEDYIKELVKSQGYTDKTAKELTEGRWSHMAVPLFDPNDRTMVTCAVYLDSTDKDFFNDRNQDMIIRACMGITEFINRRWK